MILLVATTQVRAAVQADFVINWQGLSRGVITVPQTLTNATIGSYLGWNNSGSAVPGQRFYIAERTNTMTFPVDVTVGGTAVTGDGTNWLRADWGPDIGVEYLCMEFPGGYAAPTYTNVAMAGWVLFDWTETLSSTDIQWVRDNTGANTTAFNMWGAYYARSHATHPESSFGDVILAQNLKPYWYVKVHIDPSGTNTIVRLYDPANNYTLAGESTSESMLPTKAWDLAFIAGYLATPSRGVYWGPCLGVFNPTSEEVESLVPRLNYSAVSNLVSTALPGDVITLPSGTANWTNTLVIAKAITLNGGGAWLTNWFTTAANETPLIIVSTPGVVVSNLNISGSASSIANNWLGCGIAVYANGVRINHCGFTKLRVGVWNYHYGSLVDHSWLSECRINGRHKGATATSGAEVWTELWPVAYTSTNYTFWEDCFITNSWNTDSTLVAFESGQAALYCVRHTTFSWSGTSDNYQGFDAHGDDLTTRGTLATQIYANTNLFSNGAYSSRYFDLRGGQSLIYSNVCAGYAWAAPGVVAREECDIYGFPPGLDAVTNSYNFHNFGMAVAAIYNDSSTNYLAYDVNLYNSMPGDFAAPTYPHPLTGLTAAPAEPPTLTGDGPLLIRGRVLLGDNLIFRR